MNKNPVSLPERTVIIESKSGKYVYLTQSVKYTSKLKQTRPIRKAIGKLNDEGLLIPNKNYYEIFKDENLMDAADRSDFVSVGPHFVVDSIVTNNNVKELLETIFED